MVKYSVAAQKLGKAASELGTSPIKGEAMTQRNLAKMSPEAAQEACKPTPAEAVRMQKRMAGAC